MTVSWRLKYTTSMFIKSRKISQLVKVINSFIQLYDKYGFVVNFINGSNEFEAIRDDFPKLKINIAAAEKNVPEVELQIRVIEESTREVRKIFHSGKYWQIWSS